MKYKDFLNYIQKIVLYQATNKKHRAWSLSRKCELNFTTRQLADKCDVSHSTIARWLKKAVSDGVLLHKQRRLKHKIKVFNDMRFYQVKSVIEALTAVAKKKAYSVVKKLIKHNPKNVTLKYIFKNIRITTKHGKTKWLSKTKLNILAPPDYFDFMVPLGKNGAWVALSEFDARTYSGFKNKRKVNKQFESEMFSKMIEMLS